MTKEILLKIIKEEVNKMINEQSVEDFYKQKANQAVADADEQVAAQQRSAQQASQGDINNPNQGQGPTGSKAAEMKIKQGLAKMAKQLEKALKTLKTLNGGYPHGDSSTPEVEGIFTAIRALKAAAAVPKAKPGGKIGLPDGHPQL